MKKNKVTLNGIVSRVILYFPLKAYARYVKRCKEYVSRKEGIEWKG